MGREDAPESPTRVLKQPVPTTSAMLADGRTPPHPLTDARDSGGDRAGRTAFSIFLRRRSASAAPSHRITLSRVGQGLIWSGKTGPHPPSKLMKGIKKAFDPQGVSSTLARSSPTPSGQKGWRPRWQRHRRKNSSTPGPNHPGKLWARN